MFEIFKKHYVTAKLMKEGEIIKYDRDSYKYDRTGQKIGKYIFQIGYQNYFHIIQTTGYLPEQITLSYSRNPSKTKLVKG